MILLAAEQVTTNPNAFDSWLGRAYTLLLIVAALFALYRLAHRSFKKAIDEQTEDLRADAKTVKQALDTHTQQEAGIVRQEITIALQPVTTELARLGGRLDAINAERDAAIRRNEQDHADMRTQINATKRRRKTDR